jgi:hypothetical protein
MAVASCKLNALFSGICGLRTDSRCKFSQRGALADPVVRGGYSGGSVAISNASPPINLRPSIKALFL